MLLADLSLFQYFQYFILRQIKQCTFKYFIDLFTMLTKIFTTILSYLVVTLYNNEYSGKTNLDLLEETSHLEFVQVFSIYLDRLNYNKLLLDPVQKYL